MTAILRILDADPRALEARVQRALAAVDEPCVVDRFTHWYTSRPPIHEAVLLAGGAAPETTTAPAA